MKNKKQLMIGVLIGILVLGGFLIASNITGFLTITDKDSIKIGVISSQTGVGSYLGQQQIRGFEIALEEINNNGGINGQEIKLIFEDSKSEAKEGVNVANKLINIDKVKYIIGDSWNDTTVAIVPMINEKEIIMISPVTNLNQLSQNDFFFRTMPTTKEMVTKTAYFLETELNVKKIGVIYPGTAFSQEHLDDLREYFKDSDVEIFSEKVEGSDYSSQLTKLKSKEVEVIYNLHFTGLLGSVMEQAKKQDLEVIWVSHFGAENNILIKEFRDVSDGVYYSYPYNSENIDLSHNFIKSYYEKYNEYPDNTAVNAYDTLKILSMALEESKDTKEIKRYLENLKDYKGAGGVFSFDENGDVKKEIIMKQIKDGEFINID
jgi:branched-chain amino acid transport system substrate-binding protein